MTLTIELNPDEEARLAAAARLVGIEPAEIIKKLVIEYLPPITNGTEENPTLALFAQWDREDAQMTPAEVAEENQQWEEFKANINAERDRAGARRVF